MHNFLRLAVALGLIAASAFAQSPTDAFREEQQVTAVDILVELAGRRAQNPEVPLPSYLAPEDFEIVLGEETLPVISASAYGPGQHLGDNEPWTFVIYFDLSLTSPHDVSWAAGELTAVARRLADLGAVQVVIADPAPRLVLDATRDGSILESVLGEIALFPEGTDHEILTLRDDLLAELAKSDSEIDPAKLLPFAMAEERRLARRQSDALLAWMADVPAGARRVLFLSSAGFDLDLEAFYRPHLAAHGVSPKGDSVSPTDDDVGDLVADIESSARALAAYGWITYALLPPAKEKPPSGIRIGRWVMGKPRGTTRETPIDPTNPSETVSPVAFNFFNFTRDNPRKPEKGADYLEFGQKLMEDEDWEEAEQAFRMAIYHFGRGEKNQTISAEAHVYLGTVLAQQGRQRDSREAYARAQVLDSERVIPEATPLGELSVPTRPLEILTHETRGQMVRGIEVLPQILTLLPRRVRLTFQLPSTLNGELLPVDVRCLRKNCRLNAPAWVRSGTPDAVATARLRHWLTDDQFEGALDVKARLHTNEAYRIEVDVEIPDGISPGEAENPRSLRLTLGFGDPETIASFHHLRPQAQRLADEGRWRFTADFSSQALDAEGQRGVVVLVEHMDAGHWGTAVVELPTGP